VSPYEEVRKPTIDCLVSFEGSRYSVPHFFAKRDVWLNTSKGYLLEIYSTANYQPQLDEKLIRELASLHFLRDAKNILLLGPPGVGPP
jgi:hypothetical protein